MSFRKDDQGKPRTDLLPPKALMAIAAAYAHGAEKYGDHNWINGASWGRYYGALLRHCFAWWAGEDKDPDTGFHHLAHAGANALIVLEYVLRGIGNDSRPVEPPAPATEVAGYTDWLRTYWGDK